MEEAYRDFLHPRSTRRVRARCDFGWKKKDRLSPDRCVRYLIVSGKSKLDEHVPKQNIISFGENAMTRVRREVESESKPAENGRAEHSS
jgi:hypothetical protein